MKPVRNVFNYLLALGLVVVLTGCGNVQKAILGESPTQSVHEHVNTIELAPNAAVLPTANIEKIDVSTANNTIKGPADVVTQKEGDVIISGVTAETPQGLLVKVVRREETPGGVILHTEPAALTDAIKNCDIEVKTVIDYPGSNSPPMLNAINKNIKTNFLINEPNLELPEIKYGFKISFDMPGIDLPITGDFTYTSTTKTSINLRLKMEWFKVEEFWMYFDSYETIERSLNLNLGENFTGGEYYLTKNGFIKADILKGQYKTPYYIRNFNPIPIPGISFLYIQPTFEVFVGLKYSLFSGTLKIRNTGTNHSKSGIQLNNGNMEGYKYQPVWSPDLQPLPQLPLGAEAKASVFIEPRFTASLNGTAGLYMGINCGLNLEVNEKEWLLAFVPYLVVGGSLRWLDNTIAELNIAALPFDKIRLDGDTILKGKFEFKIDNADLNLIEGKKYQCTIKNSIEEPFGPFKGNCQVFLYKNGKKMKELSGIYVENSPVIYNLEVPEDVEYSDGYQILCYSVKNPNQIYAYSQTFSINEDLNFTLLNPKNNDIWQYGNSTKVKFQFSKGNYNQPVNIYLYEVYDIINYSPTDKLAENKTCEFKDGYNYINLNIDVKKPGRRKLSIEAVDNKKLVCDTYIDVKMKFPNVIYPDSKEFWENGSTRILKWDKNNDAGITVKITAVKSGFLNIQGEEIVIVDSTQNDGQFEWAIPKDFPKADYLIKVTATDNQYCTAISSTPIALYKTPKVLIPNDDSKILLTRQPWTIKWDTQNDCEGKVKISLTMNDFVVDTFGGKQFDNQEGSCTVTTKELHSGKYYKIRVSDTTGKIYDESDELLEIHTPPDVIYPGDKDTLAKGVPYTITWMENDGGEKVDIFLVDKNTNQTFTIKKNATNNGSYAWNPINYDAGNNYYIRIVSSTNPAIKSEGGIFTIREPIRPTPTQPAEYVQTGQTTIINWLLINQLGQHNDAGSTVDIILFSGPKGTTNWAGSDVTQTTLAEKVSNIGTWPWTVPSDIDTNRDYMIKIVGSERELIYGKLDQSFQIKRSPRILAPVADEVVEQSKTPYKILWKWQNDASESVKIEILLNGSVVKTFPSVPNTQQHLFVKGNQTYGYLDWEVTSGYEFSDKYKIRITDNGDQKVAKPISDEMDKPFEIKSGPANLKLPFSIDPAVSSVTVTPASVTLKKGDTQSVSAEVKPSDALNTVYWMSSNTSVATISGGVITAHNKGKATIKAVSKDDSSKFDTCVVTVAE